MRPRVTLKSPKGRSFLRGLKWSKRDIKSMTNFPHTPLVINKINPIDSNQGKQMTYDTAICINHAAPYILDTQEKVDWSNQVWRDHPTLDIHRTEPWRLGNHCWYGPANGVYERTKPRHMTDLEMTKLCAEAMGIEKERVITSVSRTDWHTAITLGGIYDPLHDDAQALALVKKFDLRIYERSNDHWRVAKPNPQLGVSFASHEQDLNRAICECVANMQKGKS